MPKATRISTVTERGQTSIPAELRSALHLEPGRQLLWENLSETELKVVVLPESKPVGARAMLGFAKKFRPVRSSEDWMKELREGEEP